ncbi:phospholipid carrier-dependent glycosyltransferase [Candidatus Peribacteria bacterium]|nr:phospholipid carrier-dependent glycosyltransferase [Candidatus Peribacteria bacterium]
MWFQKKEPSSSSLYVWLTAGVVFFLKSLFILLTSIRGLASTAWLIDDSLIEMKVARNLGLGFGFSLDGLHATTGAPFLWIYLTSLNHMVFGKDAAIRATLIETSLLGALATVVVFAIALKLTKDRRVAWTAFLLSTFTANAFFNGMNGMDTVLFTLLVLLSISTYFGIGKPVKWSSFAWGCVIGLVLGLTVLTRGDGIFVIFALLCVKFYDWWVASASERREHMRSLWGIVLVSGICFALFMSWQLLQTGSPFPGNQVGRRELALAFHGFSFDAFSLPKYLKIVVWNIFQLEDLLMIALGGSLLALAGLVTGLLHQRLRMLGIFTVLYLGIFFSLLVGYQWYFANLHGLRYLNPAVHILFIFIAFLLWQLPTERFKRTAVAVLTASIIVLSGYKHYQMTTRFPWAPYMSYISRPDPEKSAIFWGTIDWMQDNLPAGTIVGVRDYGRASLFTDVRVQDLAGNIDPEAARTLNDGTLNEYLRSRSVEYLLIPSLELRQDKLYQYLHSKLRLELVKEAPKSPTQYLYKIIW